MSRHYNTKHPERGVSNYPRRLAARGLSKSPPLPSLAHLRSRQEARKRTEGHPWKTWGAPVDTAPDNLGLARVTREAA
jgi:hypothetical protein